MAILESIRKRGIFLILVIGLALFAFVISGAIDSSGFKTGKVSSNMGQVNGNVISREDFALKVENNSRRLGPNATTAQIVNSVWNQEVRKAVLAEQIENLGINIEKDQIVNIIKNNPAFAQDPTFQNEAGLFDEGKFIEFIADLRANNQVAYEGWKQQEESLIEGAKQQMYFNLIKAGVGATLKDGELEYKLENDKVDIKYVRIPYTSIADSTVAISKNEIKKYIEEHQDDFQEDASRDLQYVYFEEKASLDDETEAKNGIVRLLDDQIEYNNATALNDTIVGFRSNTNIEDFLGRFSDLKYDSTYVAKKNLPAAFADSIFSLKTGEIYGPYRDGNYFKVSRMMARKPNGSVKASHILIAYEGATRANPEIKRTKEEARAKADELLQEARGNVDGFAQLARDNSDGPSAPKGGDLGYFQEGVMVPAFNDFAFGNSVSTVGLVETEFGYHIVKVDDKEDIIQVATLAREVEPSEKTVNDLFTQATKFEMEASDKDFTELAKEGNYAVRPVNKIKALEENLPGLSNQRSIVQWAFNEDTEIGEIKRFNVNNGYAIVQLTGKTEEGLTSVEEASPRVLPVLRREKKAESIKQANAGKSFESLASDNNTTPAAASSLTMKNPTIAGAGREPKVVGAAFALAQGATSGLIAGENGVYMIQVTGRSDAPKLENYITYANSLQALDAGRVNSEVYNALKEAAEIEDNRADFY